MVSHRSELVPPWHTVVAITAAGAPDVLKPQMRPVPAPGDGEVLIRVRAAGVNRHDCGQRRAGPGHACSDVPGLEVAGEVAAVGRGVEGLASGVAVCALTDGGGYAEYAVAPAATVFSMPPGFSYMQAASLPEALFTIWYNLFDIGRLAPGERVLIHGGASGIGTIAIQLLTALGHNVFATCGDDRKCKAASALGARRAYNYRTEDFRSALLESVHDGIDIVLDMSGGAYSEANLDVLRFGGRVLHLSGGTVGAFSAPLRKIMAKRALITGSMLRPTPLTIKAEIAENLRRVIWPLLGPQIKPVIDSTYPLAMAYAAHAHMESNTHIGKIVLT